MNTSYTCGFAGLECVASPTCRNGISQCLRSVLKQWLNHYVTMGLFHLHHSSGILEPSTKTHKTSIFARWRTATQHFSIAAHMGAEVKWEEKINSGKFSKSKRFCLQGLVSTVQKEPSLSKYIYIKKNKSHTN